MPTQSPHRQPLPHSELQRLHMLQTMGITTYVSRQPLPGAAPVPAAWLAALAAPARSPERRLEPTAAVTGPAPAAPVVATIPERGRWRAALEADSAAAPAAVSAATPVPTLAAAPLAGQEARFQAVLLPVSPQLAVLSLLPALARQPLPERERTLLQAILRWLGLADASLRHPHAFQWPLPGLPGGDLPLAGASLRAFLDQAQREMGFARLLIFGGLLTEALELGGGLRDAYSTYALQELLAVPALKRESWLVLEPLRVALAARSE